MTDTFMERRQLIFAAIYSVAKDFDSNKYLGADIDRAEKASNSDDFEVRKLRSIRPWRAFLGLARYSVIYRAKKDTTAVMEWESNLSYMEDIRDCLEAGSALMKHALEAFINAVSVVRENLADDKLEALGPPAKPVVDVKSFSDQTEKERLEKQHFDESKDRHILIELYSRARDLECNGFLFNSEDAPDWQGFPGDIRSDVYLKSMSYIGKEWNPVASELNLGKLGNRSAAELRNISTSVFHKMITKFQEGYNSSGGESELYERPPSDGFGAVLPGFETMSLGSSPGSRLKTRNLNPSPELETRASNPIFELGELGDSSPESASGRVNEWRQRVH
ncbi:hypothetical protein BDZ97DRAFT_1756419 [Flammula alnicola]|nr:hypothetical protein BDZ97DRAFT_1756419 [Flammula alnicola]